MQAAIDHLEKHKVFVDTLGTDMIPLSEAYAAIQLSIDQQLLDATAIIEDSLGKLGIDVSEIQNELEND
jgi:hypothetical protein